MMKISQIVLVFVGSLLCDAKDSSTFLTPRARLAEELKVQLKSNRQLVKPLLSILDQVSDEDLTKWADQYTKGEHSSNEFFQLEIPNNSGGSTAEMDAEKAKFIVEQLAMIFNRRSDPYVQRNQLYTTIRHRLQGTPSTAEQIISALQAMSDESLLLFEKQHGGESQNKLPFIPEPVNVWSQLGHLSRQSLKDELVKRLPGIEKNRQDAMENVLAAASDSQLFLVQEYLEGMSKGTANPTSDLNDKKFNSGFRDNNESTQLSRREGHADPNNHTSNPISDNLRDRFNPQSDEKNILNLKDKLSENTLVVFIHPEVVNTGFKIGDVLINTPHHEYTHAVPSEYQRDFKSLDFTDLSPSILFSLSSPDFLKDSQRVVAAATAGSSPYVGDLFWKSEKYPNGVCVRLFDVMTSVVAWNRKKSSG